MYGLGDEISGLRDDVELLKGMIEIILEHVPDNVRKLVIITLKAKNLLPKGLEKDAPTT